jgi:hypothetical protein
VDPNKTLLPWLLGGAVGLGGILQGLHWKSTSSATNLAELETQLRIATEENAMLKRENESLRSLAQGGGELSVPRELADRVTRECGLDFLSSPVVHRIAGEELRDRVGAALESRMGPSGIDDRQEAYRLIGWLDSQAGLLTQLTAVRAVGARGWFDEVTGEAWVADHYDPESIPDQAALVRLLARILLHQHFPPPPAYPGDDAARAREALHHGAAMGAEARFLAANARAIGFVPIKENTEVTQLLATLSPFVRGLTGFAALEGKGLADTLYVKGNDSFHAAFHNPPQTTRAIMHPASPVTAPETMNLPVVPEEAYLSESAGQLGLRLWLDPADSDRAASETAEHWKNDRYLLIPDGDASTAVLWDIEMDSKEATDQLEAFARRIIAARENVGKIPAAGAPEGSQAKRHLSISRPSPTRVRFLNTATAELATTFTPAVP